MQVALFCLAIGRDPRGLGVAVVNEDLIGWSPSSSSPSSSGVVGACGPSDHSDGCILGQRDGSWDFVVDSFVDVGDEDDTPSFDFDDAHRKNLSCRFLSHLDPEVRQFFPSLDPGVSQN